MQTREERKEYLKKWRENNKDKIKIYQKEYNKNNKEKILKRQKEYNKNHKEKKQEIIKICKSCKKEFIAKRRSKIFCSKECGRKEYNENHKEEIREHDKKRRENNKDKIKIYQKEYRENNEEEIKVYQKEYREPFRLKLHELKINGCNNCGYHKNDTALNFHHIDPKVKKFNLGIKYFTKHSGEEIKEELNKCILLCGNCHVELHYPEYNNE